MLGDLMPIAFGGGAFGWYAGATVAPAIVPTIPQAIATRLQAVAGLHVYDRWPHNGQVDLPCVLVHLDRGTAPYAFGRGDFEPQTYQLYAFVSAAPGNDVAQDALDALLATSSTGGMYGALSADRTLGGRVSTVLVRGVDGYDVYRQAETEEYWGARMTVEVY